VSDPVALVSATTDVARIAMRRQSLRSITRIMACRPTLAGAYGEHHFDGLPVIRICLSIRRSGDRNPFRRYHRRLQRPVPAPAELPEQSGAASSNAHAEPAVTLIASLLGVLALFRRYGVILVLAIPALAFALYLAHIEERVLGVWCLYCAISLGTISLITLLVIITVLANGLRKRMRPV